jgi:hypothetical protein
VLPKTRRYSSTFGALRRARQDWRRQPRGAGLDPDATVRELDADDDPDGDQAGIVVERSSRYVGSGYFDAATAALAMAAAALARDDRAGR